MNHFNFDVLSKYLVGEDDGDTELLGDPRQLPKEPRYRGHKIIGEKECVSWYEGRNCDSCHARRHHHTSWIEVLCELHI